MGMRALAIAVQTGSGRTVTEMARLGEKLGQCHTPEVAELRSALAEIVPLNEPDRARGR